MGWASVEREAWVVVHRYRLLLAGLVVGVVVVWSLLAWWYLGVVERIGG